MANQIEIDVWQGDLADLEVDAIVVPANESLFMTVGVAARIKRRAGDAVEAAAVALGPLPPGQAVVTIGGELATPHLIHAVAVSHDLQPDPGRLRSAVRAAFDCAAQLGAARLAMSPLGSERGVFDPADAMLVIVNEVRARAGRPDAPETVIVAAATPAQFSAVEAALRAARPPAGR
jgi:O-acetyl-ADP-ribose deacetylase